jgi:hypothetical protein
MAPAAEAYETSEVWHMPWVPASRSCMPTDINQVPRHQSKDAHAASCVLVNVQAPNDASCYDCFVIRPC